MTIVLAGCKSTDPSNQSSPREINYSQYESYSFADAIILSSENPAFSWPQFSERLKREIDFAMPGKGLEKRTANPDLHIFYYAIVDTNRDFPIVPYQIGWAAEPFITSGESFKEYSSNTLVVDFIDTNTRQLVWRGSISLPFNDKNQLYKALPSQIHRLLQQYPLLPK